MYINGNCIFVLVREINELRDTLAALQEAANKVSVSSQINISADR